MRRMAQVLVVLLSYLALSPSFADDFERLARRCAPEIAVDTLRAVVKTESNFNPYAIGVVGGSVKQPASFLEAIQTIAKLEDDGKNFSVGLAQINKGNFTRLGIDAAKALDACTNLRAASVILRECFAQASKNGKDSDQALHDALSCYYSGNFSTGYRSGYVNAVRKNAGLDEIKVPSITKNLTMTARKRGLIEESVQASPGLIF